MPSHQSRNEDWIVAVICMMAVLMLSFFYSDNKKAPDKTATHVEQQSTNRAPASLESVNPEE
jgi:hypothetical protein